MSLHRRVTGINSRRVSISPPFSNFDFIESHFEGQDAIRRIFSLARSAGAEELILEDIEAKGILLDEQAALTQMFTSFAPGPIIRASFWKQKKPMGFAIFKRDSAVRPDLIKINKWHVFEAVIPKYEHEHNCVRATQAFTYRCQDAEYTIQGRLYCQQNELNKACAQVALRTILAALVPAGDVSYLEIQSIADSVLTDSDESKPWEGLNPAQIRAVLNHYSIRFSDFDYQVESQIKPDVRKYLPYQKFIYAGVESGGGALIGFEFSLGKEGTAHPDAKHIIPAYGHTFNKDTWIPHAEDGYFHLGADLHYIPSELWTSSFLAHDDNFGPNYCIPRLYIEPTLVDYVVEIFRPGVCYSGLQAEAVGLEFLLAARMLCDTTNPWGRRLQESLYNQRIVLRAVALSKDEYLAHVSSMHDWNGTQENPLIPSTLAQFIPDFVWMVEFSTYHLFPANERKLGEVVLNASCELNWQEKESLYCLIRNPGQYIIPYAIDPNSAKQLVSIESQMLTHTPVWRGDNQ